MMRRSRRRLRAGRWRGGRGAGGSARILLRVGRDGRLPRRRALDRRCCGWCHGGRAGRCGAGRSRRAIAVRCVLPRARHGEAENAPDDDGATDGRQGRTCGGLETTLHRHAGSLLYVA